MVRDSLVRIVSPKPKPTDEIVIGVPGCPCIHVRRSGSDTDSIDISIRRGAEMIEAFSLTTAEQKRLREALEVLTRWFALAGIRTRNGGAARVGTRKT